MHLRTDVPVYPCCHSVFRRLGFVKLHDTLVRILSLYKGSHSHLSVNYGSDSITDASLLPHQSELQEAFKGLENLREIVFLC